MPDNNAYIDLHLHTHCSDGSDAPRRVVERAAELNLAAIAITDHDTVLGVEEAVEAGGELGVEVLPGVEISSWFQKSELHILGLGIDPACEELQKALEKQVNGRFIRAQKIVERLNALDVPITMEAVQARVGDGAIGRIHIAQEVLALGHATSVQGVFDQYIKAGRPAYMPKEVISLETAIDLIHAANGLAFVAHPGLGKNAIDLETLFAHPFDGIEVIHSRHSPDKRAKFEAFAKDRGLLMSGGSDCHGTAKKEKPLMGTVQVPIEFYMRIREALDR